MPLISLKNIVSDLRIKLEGSTSFKYFDFSDMLVSQGNTTYIL